MNRRFITHWIVLVIAVAWFFPWTAPPAYCQSPAQAEGETLNPGQQAIIIDSVVTAFNAYYIYPDTAREMEAYVREKYKNGAYADITALSDFADTLMSDLQKVSHDGHAYVIPLKERDPSLFPFDSLLPEEREELIRRSAYTNHGFYKLERLEGNVGYIDLRQFCHPAYAGETAVAAMNFLAHCDAFIFDLRQNGGGDGEMGHLLSSYFFGSPTHLKDWVFVDRVEQIWTQDYVPGTRLPDVPLYILMSARSFSAAEGFTFGLQNRKRVTVVGERTRGGGHPITSIYFPTLHIMACVPDCEVRNPENGTTFQAIGIIPDIPVPQEQALNVAHQDALRQILKRTTDESKKKAVTWSLETMEALSNPIKVEIGTLKKYTGKYGPRTITLEKGTLYYQREGRPRYRLIPLLQDTFVMDEDHSVRVKFVLGPDGKAKEVDVVYDDGTISPSPRS